MRGYFGVGVEGISKSMNAGAIFRTAHAFGASFVFTVNANYERGEGSLADTSNSLEHLPFYGFPKLDDMLLPQDCRLVGVELTEDSVELPSFRHPSKCAYVLGPERGSLSPEMVEKCEFIVKIPTSFCINVSVAAALVMYDRSLSMGKFAERPVRAGGPVQPKSDHQHGGPVLRQMDKFKTDPPVGPGFDPKGFSA
ncbi:RNA methyltransferase [Magnetovibrio sp. PR-2]|uniref:RNA methyltransferase n=1 Tax=Magnetovibrio sp. PR-2 TaxID=3120356 RepID=UPI002FCDE2F1